MAEETSDAMNLDLNLGPDPDSGSGPTIPSDAVNLDDWMDDPIDRLRDTVRRSRQWRRWRYSSRTSPDTPPLPMELNQLISNAANATTLHEGEGSIAAEERTTTEVPKTCENTNGFLLDDDVSEKKDDEEKSGASDGSYFDCNICLDLSSEPVVTCCGHLFCWPCLYRWLHLHSDAKECPVCKGEVSMKTLTPIYGLGNNTSSRGPEEDLTLKIPSRPQARRVESLRQTIQNTPFGFPVEEMIRRLGSRFDLNPARDSENTLDTAERTNFLLNRILTSRGLRGEQSPAPPPDDTVDLTESDSIGTGTGTRETRRLHSLLLRRQSSSPGVVNSLSFNNSALSSAFEAYLRNRPASRNQEQPTSVDDRDSFSSIAAVNNSESQVDTAVEIDSMVSHSTSSSRRRSDNSRDRDSGESRAPRRRRLN
ncbi:hypothetical protein ACFE04_000301 [Oxalis oulophora]